MDLGRDPDPEDYRDAAQEAADLQALSRAEAELALLLQAHSEDTRRHLEEEAETARKRLLAAVAKLSPEGKAELKSYTKDAVEFVAHRRSPKSPKSPKSRLLRQWHALRESERAAEEDWRTRDERDAERVQILLEERHEARRAEAAELATFRAGYFRAAAELEADRTELEAARVATSLELAENEATRQALAARAATSATAAVLRTAVRSEPHQIAALRQRIGAADSDAMRDALLEHLEAEARSLRDEREAIIRHGLHGKGINVHLNLRL